MKSHKIEAGQHYAVRESRHHKGVLKAVVVGLIENDTPALKNGSARKRVSHKVRVLYDGDEKVRQVHTTNVLGPWEQFERANGRPAPDAVQKPLFDSEAALKLALRNAAAVDVEPSRIRALTSVIDFNTGDIYVHAADRDGRIFRLGVINEGWKELPGLPE